MKGIRKYQYLDQEKLNEELLLACSTNNVKAVDYLVNSKELGINADMSHKNNFPFKHACYYKSNDVIRFFLWEKKLEITPDLVSWLNDGYKNILEIIIKRDLELGTTNTMIDLTKAKQKFNF